MSIDGAIIKEQGITFGIIIVKEAVIFSPSRADKVRGALPDVFQGIPLILASQDLRGVFSYQGRPDIVSFLASIDASRIPWKKYTF